MQKRRKIHLQRGCYVVLLAGLLLAYGHVLKSRRILWCQQMPNAVASVSPVTTDGTLFAADVRGNLWAMNAATGNIQWQCKTEEFPKLTLGSQVYVSVGSILAIDRHTGKRLWTFKTSNDYACVTVGGDGTVYAGADQVYALDAATGKPRWTYKTGAAVTSGLTLHNGILYGSDNSPDFKVYALNAAIGARLWTFDKGGGAQQPIVCPNGTVVSQSYGDSSIYALQGNNGRVLWKYDPPRWSNIYSAADQNNDVYCVDRHGLVVKLRCSDGRIVWQTQLNAKVTNAPTIYNNQVYIGADVGTLYTLDAQNGNIQNRFQFSSLLDQVSVYALITGEGPTSPVIGPHGTLYIGTPAGKIYALKPN